MSVVGGVLVAAFAAAAILSTGAGAVNSSTYLVVYNGSSVPNGASASIQKAGGSIAYSYDKIGVVVARSSSPTFAADVSKDNKVMGASSTAGFATSLDSVESPGGAGGAPSAGVPAPGADPLSGLQWDMNQIQAPAARKIDGGSPSILVGDIDTGLDYTHPDLAANVDDAASVNCVSGTPVQGKVAAMDDNGHGTHTAGTIAAALNGVGIVGVAPNVRIAGIKAGDANGFFFPEAVVCAFMWAGSHNVNVTNNSYFADPWLFNCKNDPGQRAIWTAERRAIQYAQQQGTFVVAAEGNQADDVSHPTADATSPDDTNPVNRTVHNNCAVVPLEVPGVIGVTADGNLGFKSFYSSYGVNTATVMAPGGDSILQATAAAPNGRVLSTWPASLIGGCARPVFDGAATYCYAQGTSMASPHAAGVAALIMSQHPTLNANAVAARLQQSADAVPCPTDLSIYDFFPAVDNGAPQSCQGGAGHNSFAGAGQIDALTAVQ
jgi:subtilisin family serine protease